MAVELPALAVPAQLGAVAAAVEDRLRRLLHEEEARWAEVDPELGAPVRTLADLVLVGGKRLRPAFCHCAFVGVGGDPDDPRVVDAGAALELLHAFALLHDDVMDGASHRRGLPAAHQVWQASHEKGSWRGEGRRFGEGVAVLVGDLAFVYADRLLGGAPAPARRVYDELRVELTAGQFLDLLHTARGDVDVPTARRIAVLKSARYTVERPLHLGAALAGRLAGLAEDLSAYGLALGEAFQLRDDLLGAFGDAGTTGKPVGDDLRDGKPTLLLALALERADAAQAAVLSQAGAPGLGDDDVAAIQDVLVATGARDDVERRIEALAADALRAGRRLALAPDARRALLDLAELAAWRDR